MYSSQLFTCIVAILSILLMLSCSQKPASKQVNIKWERIAHSQKQMDFCDINSGFGANDFVITYSHSFAIGGGFKVLKVNFGSDSLVSNVLLKGENKVVSHVSSEGNIIGCIQHDFENRTLRTNLLVTDDSTYSWTIRDTPITGLRKMFFLKDRWLIEGNLDGTGRVFESLDKGNSWREINLLAKGYKSFYLLTPLPLSNTIFCMGSTSYNEKESHLLLFNAEDREVEEIAHLGSSTNYVAPVSKGTSLHAIVDGDKINLYSYSDNKLSLDKTMEVPQSNCLVKNLYVDEVFVIATTEPLEIGAKAVSWISYDQGIKWEPYYREKGFKLIHNSVGDLFMADAENNILRGTY